MKKKIGAFFAIAAVLLALSLIAFRPSSQTTESKPSLPTCCKKAGKCTGSEKEGKTTPNQFFPESLSQQFISISPAVY